MEFVSIYKTFHSAVKMAMTKMLRKHITLRTGARRSSGYVFLKPPFLDLQMGVRQALSCIKN